MTIRFESGGIDSEARLLAAHTPDGHAWVAKNIPETNMNKLIIGLAGTYFRLSILMGEVADEIDINQTVSLIKEWEISVGIPDSCIPNSGSLSKRREFVLNKLTNFGGVQTKDDFVRVAQILGFTAVIKNGVEFGVFPLGFPIEFYASKSEASHTIIVELVEERSVFPLAFPIQFTSGISGILQCLFRKLAPANCQIIFRYGV